MEKQGKKIALKGKDRKKDRAAMDLQKRNTERTDCKMNLRKLTRARSHSMVNQNGTVRMGKRRPPVKKMGVRNFRKKRRISAGTNGRRCGIAQAKG